MVIIFWVATSLLLLCAFAFVLARLNPISLKVAMGFSLAVVTYALYFQWGYGLHLPHYYSIEEKKERLKQFEFRKLLAEFRKQEFRLQIRLEEEPKDLEAKWKLYDLQGIKALQNRDYAQAVIFWKQAVSVLKTISTQNSNLNQDLDYNAIISNIINRIQKYESVVTQNQSSK